MFIGLMTAVKKKVSLRASAHTGVAIPIGFPGLFMEEIVGFLRNHFRFFDKTLLRAAIGDRHTSLRTGSR